MHHIHCSQVNRSIHLLIYIRADQLKDYLTCRKVQGLSKVPFHLRLQYASNLLLVEDYLHKIVLWN